VKACKEEMKIRRGRIRKFTELQKEKKAKNMKD
jgi:hypothetical protein